MQTETLPLDETDCFSQSFLDYINQKKELRSFYNLFPSIENFKELINQRGFDEHKRKILSKTLLGQYENLETSNQVISNIQKLSDSKTYTITTGHQLNIFTGPLYFIYKIVTVINACKKLKIAYPEYEFVPVYWMASEDHDFEEISHFFFEGKKIEWDSDQTGAVGRMNPSDLAEIANRLPQGAEFFQKAYKSSTLAQAAQAYVNHLFQDEGLVVIDADDQELKRLLVPVIEDDLFNHNAERLVSDSSNSLNEIGFKTQVNAREINFFYLSDNLRERFEKTSDGFKVTNSDIKFSENEVRKLIEKSPEQFSPNVILRPLYQEIILPNLAYVGGPSELLYWLQLKSTFDHYDVPFPALLPRNFATILEKSSGAKWDKVGLNSQDLFLDVEEASSKWVKANSSKVLSYADDLSELETLQSKTKKKAGRIDETLEQHVEAIYASFMSKLSKAEKKLLRAEKRKYNEKKEQIKAVKTSLFPGGSLQERKLNFLTFYLKDPSFVQFLLNHFDPFKFEMYLFKE